MKLVLTTSIRKAEFETLKETFFLEVVKVAAKKTLLELGKEIKSAIKISSTALKKISITSSGGAGRAAFLLKLRDEKAILVMIRLKNDKQIGANMTVKNSKFKKALEKNLSLLIKDIENGEFEEFEL